MSLLNIIDVAGSGMSAQSVRLNTTASNLANANSAASSSGEVYRARHPVFAAVLQEQASGLAAEAGHGVQVAGIVTSDKPADLRYEPGHPLADERGYVAYPAVNVMEEMADMISASRSFQMNVEVLGSARSLAEEVLRLGQ